MLFTVALQLFWFSFAAIGLACIMLLDRILPRVAQVRSLKAFMAEAHPITVALACFAAGIALFSLPMAAAYIFELPVIGFVSLYLLILAGSVTILWFGRSVIKTRLRRVWQLARRNPAGFVLVLLAIGAGYAISLAVGGSLIDDTPIHLAKIQMFLNIGHFSLADPDMGYNGVIDVRYSTNVLNGLQAVAAKLFSVPAYKVWFSSFAFYRLLLGASIFALAKEFLGRHIPWQWPYYVLILIPYFNFTYMFDYVELPHAVALVWTSLLLIGLKSLFERNSVALLCVATILTAATHSISAAYTAAFLGLLLVAAGIFRAATRKQLFVIAIMMLILALPVVGNLLIPSRSASPVLHDMSGHGLHERDLTVTKAGPLVLPKLTITDPRFYRTPSPQHFSFPIDPLALPALLVLAGYTVLLKRLKSVRSKRVSLLLMAAAVLATFNTLYMSIVTYVYLVRNTKHKGVKIMLVLAIMFFALIAYDPIVLTVVFGRLPIWLIARFQDFNTFVFIAPILGVFILYRLVARYWGIPQAAGGAALFALMLLAGWIFYRFPLNTGRIVTLDRTAMHDNASNYQILKRLAAVDDVTRGHTVYSDDGNVETWLPVITTGRIGEVVNIQSSTESNFVKRSKCYDALSDTLSYSDLQAAGVTRVVLRSGKGTAPYQRKVSQLAVTKSYLKAIKHTDRNTVYAVIGNAAGSAGSICAFPYRQ